MVNGIDIGGLDEMCGKSRLAGSLTIVLLAVASQRDQMRSLGCGVSAQAARNFIAIHLRQADVQKDHFRSHALHGLEGSRRTVCNLHLMPFEPQEHGQRVCEIRIVIDHEDSALGCGCGDTVRCGSLRCSHARQSDAEDGAPSDALAIGSSHRGSRGTANFRRCDSKPGAEFE